MNDKPKEDSGMGFCTLTKTQATCEYRVDVSTYETRITVPSQFNPAKIFIKRGIKKLHFCNYEDGSCQFFKLFHYVEKVTPDTLNHLDDRGAFEMWTTDVLPQRIRNTLRLAGISTMRSLLKQRSDELKKYKNFSNKSLILLLAELDSQGLNLYYPGCVGNIPKSWTYDSYVGME